MKSGLEEFLKRIEAKPTNETLIDRFMTLALEEEGVDRILYLKKLVGLLLKSNPYAALKAAYVELQEARKEKLSNEYEVGALKDVESCFINLGKTQQAALVREEINKLASGTAAEPPARPARPGAPAPAQAASRPSSKPTAPVKDALAMNFNDDEPTQSNPPSEPKGLGENSREPPRPMRTQEPKPGIEMKPIPSFGAEEFKSLATKIEPIKNVDVEKAAASAAAPAAANPAAKKPTRNAPKPAGPSPASAPAPAAQAPAAPPPQSAAPNDFFTAVAVPAASAPAFGNSNESSLQSDQDLDGETQVSPFLAQKLGSAAATPGAMDSGKPLNKAPGKSVPKPAGEPVKAKPAAQEKPAPIAPPPQDDDDQGAFAMEYTKRNPAANEAAVKGKSDDGLRDLPEQHFYSTPSSEIDEQYEAQPFFQPDDDDEEAAPAPAERRPSERTMLISLEKLNESKDQINLAAASTANINDVDLPVNSGPNFMVLPDDEDDLPALTRETLQNMRANAINFDPDRSHASLMFQSGVVDANDDAGSDEDTVNDELPKAIASEQASKSPASLFSLGDEDESDHQEGQPSQAMVDPFLAPQMTNANMAFINLDMDPKSTAASPFDAFQMSDPKEQEEDYPYDPYEIDSTQNDIEVAVEPEIDVAASAPTQVKTIQLDDKLDSAPDKARVEPIAEAKAARVEPKVEPNPEPKIEPNPEPKFEASAPAVAQAPASSAAAAPASSAAAAPASSAVAPAAAAAQVKVVPRPESATIITSGSPVAASIPMHEPELDFAMEEAEAEASLHREAVTGPAPVAIARPAIMGTWSLFRERLGMFAAIHSSRMQGVDFVKKMLHAKTETPLVQKTLDLLLQFVGTELTEDSHQSISDWLFEELDPMAAHHLLSSLNLQDEGLELYQNHVEQLMAKHQHRRALGVMRDLLRFELDIKWYRESYPYLVKVWARLGLEGWHWREEEGSQVFCDRLVRREDPRLYALLA